MSHKVPEGKLAHVEMDAQQSSERIVSDHYSKENPQDFVLWKAWKEEDGKVSWESPWGKGRPGWHIECSAMSSTHLGDCFDIHGGGRDLIFPHHENEIAQSQGAHGENTFSKYWVHNGFIDFAGEKMSKSLGNFFTTREIIKLYDPETVRYFLLTVHYRSGLNFEVEVMCPACGAQLDKTQQDSGACRCGVTTGREELRQRVRFPGLEEADERLAYVYQTLAATGRFLDTAKKPASDEAVLEAVASLCDDFVAHMRNDFNTSGALGALSKPLAEANGLLASGKGVSKAVRYLTLEKFALDMSVVADILGCFGQDPDTWLLQRRDQKSARMGLDQTRVDELVAQRVQARQDKDWAEADRLRAELADLGVGVQDGPAGSVWNFL